MPKLSPAFDLLQQYSLLVDRLVWRPYAGDCCDNHRENYVVCPECTATWRKDTPHKHHFTGCLVEELRQEIRTLWSHN